MTTRTDRAIDRFTRRVVLTIGGDKASTCLQRSHVSHKLPPFAEDVAERADVSQGGRWSHPAIPARPAASSSVCRSALLGALLLLKLSKLPIDDVQSDATLLSQDQLASRTRPDSP
jgi:hypothetical protein